MRRTVFAGIGIVAIGIIAFLSAEVSSRVPEMAANGLLHPLRRTVFQRMPDNCETATFAGAGVALKGWHCRAGAHPRGTIVYLHGVADNRGSASQVIGRYTAKGFDVIAYDSRAHGESDGSLCTYGYFEKQDLRRVVDAVEHRPIVLIGNSLGAAVVLQAAAGDSRIAAVVAAETFSDLRTVARERAPWFFTDDLIARSFLVAEQSGRFEVDAVSPERAARDIRAPVLLIHGTDDRQTPAAHSQRVMSALAGPKRLILVERAGHNESLRLERIWTEIDRWIEDAVF
jgi:alpha-beta hydrolase superfamily lysophospholipase